MSITRIKGGRGTWVKCDGTDETSCPEKRHTGNIVPKHNRAWWAKQEGWGRGLRSHTKSKDFCPTHLKHEEQVAAKEKQDRADAKKRRAEEWAKTAEQRAADRAAKKAAREQEKAERKAKRSGSPAASSPSAASAPAPST